MATDLLKLQELLDEAAAGLPKVSSRKMFGCYALWAGENVFGLIWKHGRIGVKLPTETDYETLMKTKGAEPWKAGPMKMAHWVLVPETFHSKPTELKKWVHRAHTLCIKLPKKPLKS
jgi:TfoX/Sxy family transcriptional regulator of competence genes